MKLLTEDNGSFVDKVNFVDENNVFLGYDLSQDCCEQADWFVSINIIDKIDYDELDNFTESGKDFDFSGFVFDTEFHQTKQWKCLDEGDAELFKITNDKQVYYIYLFNSHNGYYSHGFEFINDKKLIRDGSL